MEQTIIAVVGSGAMGSGIAQLAATNGFNVLLWDLEESYLKTAIDRIYQTMTNRVNRGKMTEVERDEIIARIKTTTDLFNLSNTNFVIEAIIEDEQIKKEIFRKLDQILPAEATLVSNTSGISITAIAEATNRPEQVAGMHFFNPAPVMKLVEVIKGLKTSDETFDKVIEMAVKLGKETVEVKKDSPGFIVNRIMTAQFLEAIRLLEEGVASVEDIDKAVKLGLNYPMGPFTLMDLGGLDLGLRVMDYFYEEYKDDRFAAPVEIRRLIKAGKLGKKTGEGWYNYDKKLQNI